MKRNKRRSLAYRDEFFAGRLGIRGRLLLDLAILIGFVLSLVWICQIALLYGFYQADRSSQVRSAARILSQNIDNEDLENLADRISAENDICLMLIGEDQETILSIDHVRSCLLHHMKEEELRKLVADTPENGVGKVSNARTVLFRNEDYDRVRFSGNVPDNESRSGLSMLYSQRVSFSDGRRATLLINAMISPSSAMMGTLRKQYAIILAAVILVTVIFGHMMASGISRPLIETNQAAKELSRSRYARPPHSGGYREIAELNDTLVQAAADLGNVENLQRELIANISHDLRTPLTMIQGYAETMRDLPGEMTPENMQIIIDETNHLSSLVNEVLDFSRLRTGSLQLTKSVFDLTETIHAICDRVSAMTAVKGYSIQKETLPACFVKADRSLIEQVIYNLLGNALTYTGADRTVKVSETRSAGYVRISVTDSGEGIDEAELPYIWNRYFRSGESHKQAIIGSGLGLNICRGILELHQVPYGVESEKGKGCNFWFELRLETPPAGLGPENSA